MAYFLNDITKRECLAVSPDTPIEKVVSTLSSNSIGALVVQTKQGVVVGIISERDIVHSLAERKNLDGLVVDDRLLPMEEGGSSFWSSERHCWVTGHFDKTGKFMPPDWAK